MRTTWLDLLQGLATAGKLIQNRVYRGPPDKGLRILIPDLEELFDGSDQLRQAGKCVATDSLGGEFSKPALDQIQPTGTGGDLVNDEAGMAFQPGPDVRVAVGAVVVHHQVQGDLARELFVQQTQELQELLVSMALVALSDDLPLQQLDGGK